MLFFSKAQNPSISQAFGVLSLLCVTSVVFHPLFLLVNKSEGLEKGGPGVVRGPPLTVPESGLSVASSISVDQTLRRGTDGILGCPDCRSLF